MPPTQLLAQADKVINSAAPKMAVVGRVVDWGPVALGERKDAVVTVKNHGGSAFRWVAADKPGGAAGWLTLRPDRCAPGAWCLVPGADPIGYVYR